MDFSKISLDKLIGVKNLIVNLILSDKLYDVVLEFELDIDIIIGSGNKLKNVLFWL